MQLVLVSLLVSVTLATSPGGRDYPPAPPPLPGLLGTCPSPRVFGHCALFCENDAECKDGEKCCSNGCGTDCMKACKPLHCPPCKFGTTRRYDMDGCPTCSCKSCDGKPEHCQKECQNGYEKNRKGCSICSCKHKCPRKCLRLCPDGYETDANGCILCVCKKTK